MLCCAPNSCYECKDCFARPLYCVNCMLVSHAHNPLHRIKVWDSSLYIRFSNGLSFYRNGMVTSLSWSYSGSLIYIFSWGTSPVINVTTHNHASTIHLWWLRVLVFTVSLLTSATVRSLWVMCNSFSEWLDFLQQYTLLEQFHMVSLESKISAFEYYSALSKPIDNTCFIDVKICIYSWLCLSLL